MKELKKLLSILKLGATSENYPPFGSYLISDGETLKTFNADIYVSLDYKAPFIGAVNIYVFDSILANLTDDAEFKQKDDKLYIRDNNFKADLDIIEEPDIPIKEKPKVPTIEITEELLNSLKLANKFISASEPQYMYIYMGKNFISATNRSKVFLKDISETDTSISLDSKILSSLIIGTKLGATNKNVFIDYGFGFLLSQAHIVEEFPIEKISSYVYQSKEETTKLCNIAVLQDAIKKLSPIFYAEKGLNILIETKDKSLVVSAESTLNGVLKVNYDIQMEEEYSMEFDPNYVKGIPMDYDIFINPKITSMKRLYLSNDESEIVLLGKE